MKLTFLLVLYTYLALISFVGVPLVMSVSGLSETAGRYSYLSTHESVVGLIGLSQLKLYCRDLAQEVCVRPFDYTILMVHVPIALDTCEANKDLPSCDDIRLKMHFRSSDLFRIGLNL